jgi:hypothetical protein
MPHNPAAIVRLLYGERTGGRENRAKVFSLKPASNSLTSAPSVGQAVKPLFRDAWNGDGCEVVSKSRRCSGAQRRRGSIHD